MLGTPERMARFLAAMDYPHAEVEATVAKEFPAAPPGTVRRVVDDAFAQRARSTAQNDQTLAAHRDAIHGEHHTEGDA